MKLIDIRTHNGSRHYLCLPKDTDWNALYELAIQLPDAKIVQFTGEESTQPQLIFSFRGHHFLIRSQSNQLQFLVRDPNCSDLIVYQVARHFCEMLTQKSKKHGDAKMKG
jgi:hypothetical protein